MPRISVIMPVYNGEKFLHHSIESVLGQTISDWELIIVDDGSSDLSSSVAYAYAQRDGRIKVITQSNQGVGAARNCGAESSNPSSFYLIFLDQDDVWRPQALETLAAALDACPKCVAVHGNMQFIDAQGRPMTTSPIYRRRWIARGQSLIELVATQPTTLGTLAIGNVIPTPGQVLIRRQAWDRFGQFDQAMTPADDWDLWLRLSANGTIAYRNEVVIGWRQHAHNASHQRQAMAHATNRVYDKCNSLPLERRTVVQHSRRFRMLVESYFCMQWAWDSFNSTRRRNALRLLLQGLILRFKFYFGAA